VKETRATSAYDYPLLIRQLWHNTMSCNPEQEIVSGEKRRFSYRDLRARIGQLASGMASIGVKPGDTVAVMDWDNHRYLECFFAVPMMAAVLHTINVRLSPEQILYTINHAEDDFILLHADFVPIIEQIRERIETSPRFIFLCDESNTALPEFCDYEYEALLQSGDADFEFRDFDVTKTRWRRLSTLPARPVIQRRCFTHTGNWCCTRWRWSGGWVQSIAAAGSIVAMSTCRLPRCSMYTPGVSPTLPR
jgi:acyl-CoA synthetase (AMP-forming)/AMP-acid ligase II